MRTTLAVLCFAMSACGPTTVGQSCDLLGETVCGRCFPGGKADCLSGFLPACCSTTCQSKVRDPGKVLECNELLKVTPCSSLVQGGLPATCRGVAAP